MPQQNFECSESLSDGHECRLTTPHAHFPWDEVYRTLGKTGLPDLDLEVIRLADEIRKSADGTIKQVKD